MNKLVLAALVFVFTSSGCTNILFGKFNPDSTRKGNTNGGFDGKVFEDGFLCNDGKVRFRVLYDEEQLIAHFERENCLNSPDGERNRFGEIKSVDANLKTMILTNDTALQSPTDFLYRKICDGYGLCVSGAVEAFINDTSIISWELPHVPNRRCTVSSLTGVSAPLLSETGSFPVGRITSTQEFTFHCAEGTDTTNQLKFVINARQPGDAIKLASYTSCDGYICLTAPGFLNFEQSAMVSFSMPSTASNCVLSLPGRILSQHQSSGDVLTPPLTEAGFFTFSCQDENMNSHSVQIEVEMTGLPGFSLLDRQFDPVVPKDHFL